MVRVRCRRSFTGAICPKLGMGARATSRFVYNWVFVPYSWSDKNMIRFLQQSGQTTKYVLGGLLLIICASMVITLIPGGLGGEVFGGTPGKGIVAKVNGEDITADEVRQTARQMLQQQKPQGNTANMSMLLPFFTQRAAEQLITRQALITTICASRVATRSPRSSSSFGSIGNREE